MVENTEVSIKCGEILVLSNEKFSLICESCGDDFDTLEDLRVHLAEDFPVSLPHIKIEDPISYGSDRESIPPGIIDYATSGYLASTEIKNETISDCESFQADTHDELTEFTDFVKVEAASESIIEQFYSSDESSQSEQSDGNQQKWNRELQLNLKIENKNTKEPAEKNIADKFPNELKEGIQKRIDNVTKGSKELKIIELLELFNVRRDTRQIPKLNIECKFCSKKFKDNRSCRDHENAHTGRRPHQCRFCLKMFATISTLKMHLRLHTDDRLHKCSVCDKRFFRKSRLGFHIRENHLPDTDSRRYFPCNICDEKFNYNDQLIRHKRMHRGDLPIFLCDCCQKQFKTKYDLRMHMVVHSRERPHNCKFCDKAFAYRGDRYQHMRKCEDNPQNHKAQILNNTDSCKPQILLATSALTDGLH